MKSMKQVKALLLGLLMVCTMLLTCACASGEEESTDAVYSVAIKDARGDAYTSEVIVKFMQNGQQAAMQTVNESGVAEKTLPKGDYTVELMFTKSDAVYYYDAADLTLSAEKISLEITLAYAQSENTKALYADGKEYTSCYVSDGCTHVTLEAGDRNYFLFAPTVAGTYEFSVIGSDAAIGYYGAPHFVQSQSAAKVTEENTFTVSVSADMIGTNDTGTTVLVIGVDGAEEKTNCYLSVERIGDPEHTLAQEPWRVYQTTAELSAFTLPAGTSIKEFDLTAASDAYNLVLNEEDGFYHLDSADGPLVYAHLGTATAYLDSYKTILENTGVNKYFFDANGDFVKKENYTDCLLEYLEYIDEDSGLYPLTEDLVYIFQNHGDYSGWWDPEDSRYRFVDANGEKLAGINNEIAWLFLCCYEG